MIDNPTFNLVLVLGLAASLVILTWATVDALARRGARDKERARG